MSTSLLPPSPTWTPDSPVRKGGILLNPCPTTTTNSSALSSHSPLRISFSSPPSPSRSSHSLSSSDDGLSPTATLAPSSLNTSSSSNPSGSRSPSIKFAALPDPRADEEGRRLSIDGSRSPTLKELSLDVERPSSPSSGWRGHRRGSKSMDGSSMSRSRSPIGINLLNGRVYGSRVMESAKEVEKEAQKGEVFKESGSEGLGSNSKSDEDEDDRSGMAWIRKRRESRQREEREREAREAEEASNLKDLKAGLDSLLLSPASESLPSSGPKPTADSTTTPPPPAPRIQLQPPSRQSTLDFKETRKTAASAGVEIFHRHKEE